MIIELSQLPPPVAHAIMHGQVQFANNGRVVADVIKKSVGPNNALMAYDDLKTANEFLERFKHSPYHVADINLQEMA